MRKILLSVLICLLLTPLFSFANEGAVNILPLLTDERIEAIKNKASSIPEDRLWSDISIEENPDLKMPARSKVLDNGHGLIQFNPKLFNQFPQEARFFILYHELGHIRLDHFNRLAINPDFVESVEYEADVFACFMAKRFDFVSEALALFIINVVEKHSGDEQFGKNRASLIQSILFRF